MNLVIFFFSAWIVIAVISDDITQIINAPMEIRAAPIEIITFPASVDERDESGDDLPSLSDERDESGDDLLALSDVRFESGDDIPALSEESRGEGGCEQEKGDCGEDHEGVPNGGGEPDKGDCRENHEGAPDQENDNEVFTQI